jgi:hypothetical protein
LEKHNEVSIFKDLDELQVFSEYFDLKEGVQINPDSALQCLRAALSVAQRETKARHDGSGAVIHAVRTASCFAVNWGLIERLQGHIIIERLDVLLTKAFVAEGSSDEVFHDYLVYVARGEEHRLLGNELGSAEVAACWSRSRRRVENTRRLLAVKNLLRRELIGRWPRGGKVSVKSKEGQWPLLFSTCD